MEFLKKEWWEGTLSGPFFFFDDLWFPDVAWICFESFFIHMYSNSKKIKPVKPKQVFHLYQEQMIFSCKCLVKKILREIWSWTLALMNPEMHEYYSCFDHRYMKRKEEIKSQYVLSFVLPLDEKDHTDFLPRI